MLGLPVSRIHAWTRRGLLNPHRGARGAYVYSFQDIAVLRAARELLNADVPARRVGETLRALRAELPVGRPLSAVQLSALGREILVRDGDRLWNAESGQMLMQLTEASTGAPSVARLRPEPEQPESVDEPDAADDWFEIGVDLEGTDPERAGAAYRRAVEIDESHADAHLNLGRLLHEDGRVAEAETAYRAALAADPTSARAHFNLGVALEDQARPDDAVRTYRRALELDGQLAAAHFNLSRLHEEGGRKADALAHLRAYRDLVTGGAART